MRIPTVSVKVFALRDDVPVFSPPLCFADAVAESAVFAFLLSSSFCSVLVDEPLSADVAVPTSTVSIFYLLSLPAESASFRCVDVANVAAPVAYNNLRNASMHLVTCSSAFC